MAKFKVIDEAYIKYQMTTWQGEIEINGETILYRYSEDDNGAELYVYNEADGWNRVEADDNENYAILYAAIGEWGNPEEFGAKGEEVEIDDTIVEDYI
jgi:hypothetical protein